MVETRIVEEPEFRNEVELTQALREGLRELQKRGEIAPLLSPRRAFWTLPRVALAASVAAVALGTASFLFFSRQDRAPPGVLTETLYFMQTRSSGPGPDVTWLRPVAPGQLELHFDVGLAPANAYDVLVERVTDGAKVKLFEATAATSAEGEAVLELDGVALAPGNYELSLAPQQARGGLSPIVYKLRVAGS